MRKVLSSIFLIAGTIIGAGFASGREISLFFATFGLNSLYFLPILFLILFFCFYLFLRIGQNKNFLNVDEINKSVGIKGFFSLIISAIYVVFCAAMLSAAVELLKSNFPSVHKFLFLIILAVICLFVLLFGFKGVKNINFILIPALICLITFICIYGARNPVGGVFISSTRNSLLIPASMIIYAAGNIMLSYFILVEAGREMSKKQILASSLISAFIISLLVALAIICLVKNGNAILETSMPFITLCLRLGEPFNVLFVIALLIGILTSLFSGLYSACYSLKFYSPGKKVLCILAVTVLSLVGFKAIVDYSYPVIGAIGVFLIIKFFVSYRELFFKPGLKPRDYKIHTTRQNTQDDRAGHN